MTPATSALALQTTTPTPGVGVEELADYGPTVVRGLWFLAGFLVVVLLGWFGLAPLMSRVVRRRNRNNPTIAEAISRYVRLLVLLVAFFVGAGVAGYGGFIGNSAVVIAAGTLAVGVAAQTVVGSLVSGIVLVHDPEFNVGNYIEWDDGEGIIQSITIRVTRVLTPTGELITVPNTVLTEQAITRPYGRGRYCIVDRIGFSYEDDLAEAMEHLRAATEEVEEITDAPSPRVYVDAFDPDSITAQVRYWVENPQQRDLLAIRTAYARTVKRRLDEAGIDISPASQHELSGRIAVDEEDGRDTL